MTRITARVPAKINLHLGVGPLRPDGFHDLATVYQAVSLYDEVSVEDGPAGSGISLRMEGAFTDQVPHDSSNLAVRAVEKVAARYGRSPDVELTITKAIPVAAGLAGGSADAAGALIAADALWGGELSRETLLEMAAELGSDVPFSLTGGTAIGLGRGELLTAAMTRGTYHWVLVAGSGLSTPSVFSELDRLRAGTAVEQPQVPNGLLQALVSGDVTNLAAQVSNDLQRGALALRPALGRTIETAMEYGALAALVSGSGPTIAVLVRDEAHALDLTVALAANGVVDPIYRVHGPVVGARVC